MDHMNESDCISRRLRCACLAVMPGLVLAGCLVAQVQAQTGSVDETSGAEQEPAESSQQVDEREQNYRKNMELQENRFRDRQAANTTYVSRGAQEKIDQLPPASQENIKDQLRDMIMERREWKPGEDLSDYPYEPSTAARNDARLERQEREAWSEQIQKYQQREAAAYAGEPAPAGGAADPHAQETSTAGVSESALDFLQGRGGKVPAGQPGGPMENGDPLASTVTAGGPSGSESGDAAQQQTASPAPQQTAAAVQAGPAGAAETPGSLALEELSRLQGMSAAAGGEHSEPVPPNPSAADAPAAAVAQSGAEQVEEQSTAEPGETATQAGTLALDELGNMAQSTASADQTLVEKPPSDHAVWVEPGTLDLAELGQIRGIVVSAAPETEEAGTRVPDQP